MNNAIEALNMAVLFLAGAVVALLWVVSCAGETTRAGSEFALIHSITIAINSKQSKSETDTRNSYTKWKAN